MTKKKARTIRWRPPSSSSRIVKTSGVNLDGLNLEQLQILQTEIIRQTEVVLENKRQSVLSELNQSGRLQEFKAAAKQFQKEMKLLAHANLQFEITLPILFSMKGELYDELPPTRPPRPSRWLQSDLLSDFIKFTFSAKLAGNAQALGLTKNQYEILDQTVGAYAEDACDDIFELIPQNMRAEIDSFMKRFNAFQAEVKKFGLTGKDLGLE